MKIEITFKNGTKRTFDDVAYVTIDEQTANKKGPEFEIAHTPKEGKLFEVSPLGINRNLFREQKSDQTQEWLRKLILEAFLEVEKHPEKYANLFYTLIPEKIWEGDKTIVELKEYANELGGQMADWVHQALEWAQRISNGESWETLCNIDDPAKWYRLITGQNGYWYLVGGTHKCIRKGTKTCNIGYAFFESNRKAIHAVPLVVIQNSI